MARTNQLTIEFLSLPENIPFARVALAAFASQLDFTLNDLEEIKVMVSEAVSNAIIHGYGNSPHEKVTIRAFISGETLTISVEDTGRGIEDISRALEPAYSTDPERMGLGFVFMQSFSESMDVQSVPGKGTTVTLVKKLNKEAKAARSAH